MKFYQFKCWIENAWRFRKSLSRNFITDTDDLLLDINLEILEQAYDFWNDSELEEHNRLTNDQLENLQIGRDEMRIAKFMYHDAVNKEVRINKIEQAFKFVARHMNEWWI